MVVAAGPAPTGTRQVLGMRAWLDRRFDDVKKGADSMLPLWAELAEFVLPSRARFFASDPQNRGYKGRPHIVDGTATRALNIARSGLLEGLASATDPWFELTTVRPALAEDQEVKLWLRRVRDILLAVFDQSNWYTALSALFGDELLFGTAAMLMLADEETVLRCEVLPIGAFYLAQDHRGKPNAICRDVQKTVRQLVNEFGWDAVSDTTRTNWTAGHRERPVEVRHAIWPADGPSRFAWAEYYWERAGGVTAVSWDEETAPGEGLGPGEGILRVGGYHEFPGVCPRWDRNDEETWSARCPGIDALGDIKQLQTLVRAFTNAVNKSVNPPIVHGPGLEETPVGLLAGSRTSDPNMSGPGTGARALHEITLRLGELAEMIREKQQAINSTFLVPYFLALLDSARSQPLTAEETRAREREKNAVLGPIQGRQGDELLDPGIQRGLSILVRRSEPYWAAEQDGILPLPPPALLKEPLRIRYVSDVALTQRAVSLGALDRHITFVGGIAQVVPEVLDTTDWDEVAQVHANAMGIAPSITRTDEQIAAIRTARAQQQQAAMLREQAPGLAKAAKDLSETELRGRSALDALTEQPAGPA